MTMHLAQGLTTLNTKKRKAKKLSEAQRKKYETQWRQHNKDCRRKHLHDFQFEKLEDYIAYCRGQYKPKRKTETVMNTPWHYSGPTVNRETQHIPSLKSEHSFAPATKKERMVYTGERKLVGIAMMHKSNLVPVFADDDDKTGQKQATEIAQMRRN
jgi:hypothetical protein